MGTHDFYIESFGATRSVFSVTDPSNQLRAQKPPSSHDYAELHRQKIIRDNPSNIRLLSGDIGLTNPWIIDIPHTGERFIFDTLEVNAHDQVVNQIDNNSQNNDQPSHVSGDPKEYRSLESCLVHGDTENLINSIASKLEKFPMKRHPCDICARNGRLSIFQAESNEEKLKPIEPCPHSFLKNVPIIYNFADFDSNLLPNESNAKSKNIGDTITQHASQDINTKRDSGSTLYQCFPESEYDFADIDSLLTYRPDKTCNDTFKDSKNCLYNIEDVSNDQAQYSNKLNSIDTASLRIAESKIDKLTKAQPIEIPSHEHLDLFKGGEVIISKIPILSLNEWESEIEMDILEGWKCPKFYKLTYSEDTDKIDDAIDSQETASIIVKHVSNTEDGPDLALIEIEKSIYNGEMSIDALMSKYKELRKSDCPKEMIKALKHLICIKLNKQKLYIRRKHVKFAENLNYQKTAILDQIIGRINAIELEKLTDDSSSQASTGSLYTYSSLTVSSYDSFTEDLTFNIGENDYLRDNINSIHESTTDCYGWLFVTDESVSRARSKILYCELNGINFLLYAVTYETNLKDSTMTKPLMKIIVDESFVIEKKCDGKKNRTHVRINGTKVDVDDNGKVTHNRITLKLEADTHNEILNWHTALSSRSQLDVFVQYLKEKNICPLNYTIYSFLYPRRRELIFNKLPYDRDSEEFITNSFIRSRQCYVDFSMRMMTNHDLNHHIEIWRVPIDVLNLSQNDISMDIDEGAWNEYLLRTEIKKLYLDRNSLSESFFGSLLVNMILGTNVEFVGLRGCKLHDNFIMSIKEINNRLSINNTVEFDLRDCEINDEFAHFMSTYPLNKVTITSNQSNREEFEMDYFMDNKNLLQISSLGSLFSGRLSSTQWKVRKRFRIPFINSKTDNSTVDIYFEYRSPYLIWYDWCPKRRGKSFRKGLEANEDEESSDVKENQVLFVKSCNIINKGDNDWLFIRGFKPKYVAKTESYEVKILLRGYTDSATRRWHDIMNRTIAGIMYVDHLLQYRLTTPSKHILSFCTRIDTEELIMNGFPLDRRIMYKFLNLLSKQPTLKAVNFTNMELDTQIVAFEASPFKKLNLEKLDWSFNSIDLEGATYNVLNILAGAETCERFIISHNPLGDNHNSALLFSYCCFKLKASKLSFNNCKLGNNFLSKVVELLSTEDETHEFEHLRIVELESNLFMSEMIHEVVKLFVEKFPNMMTIRLYSSIADTNDVESLIEYGKIISFDRASPAEPSIGNFKRVGHVKKAKRTTVNSVAQLICDGKI